MYKLAVVGNPIAHSLSPLIFSAFSQQTGIALDYQRICAPIDRFEEVVGKFFAAGGYALNITAPFKARAYALANQHQPHTLLSQTANVLLNKDGVLTADNTDGLGLVADLERNEVELKGKNILIIGSGSVIFSVLSSLEAAKPARIDLLMRNNKLDEFSAKSNLVAEFNSLLSYDLVINTTPNTSENKLFSQIQNLNPAAYIYDMIYTAGETLFMHQLRKFSPKAKAMNGIGMLIQQAKFGFNSMFGIYPEVEAIYPLLIEHFSKK